LSVHDDCLERDDWRCWRCGLHPGEQAGNPLLAVRSVHHLLLRARGGADIIENVITLCGTGTTGCHGWVHAHPAAATASGWMRSRYARQPYSLPVLHWQQGWVTLTPEGGYAAA